MQTFALTTLGCKVNQYESAQLAGCLASLGLRRARRDEPADLWVVHTCAVTAEAMRKSRQAVRAAARTARSGVVVTGCWATARPAQAAALPGVCLVLPNGPDGQAVSQLADWLRRRRGFSGDGVVQAAGPAGLGLSGDDRWMIPVPAFAATGRGQRPATAAAANMATPSPTVKPKIPPGPASPGDRTGEPPLGAFPGHVRAFVKVQDGCDARCSFCIVPSVRTCLHSRPVDRVVAEVEALVAGGYREIVLTGVFLGAYGRTTAIRRRWPIDRPDPLLRLVDAILRIRGLARLRLSSLEPGDVCDQLLGRMISDARLVPHLHIPLQSGSDAVLERMNRQYRRCEYEQTVRRVRQALDRPAITTDVLVGFPGETEEDFQATLDLCRSAGFAQVHVFPFSPHVETVAGRRPDGFIPADVVRERAERAAALARRLARDYRRQFVGWTERVIIERADPREPDSRRGRTDRYFMVHFPPAPDLGGPAGLTGCLATVRIDAVEDDRTIGVLLDVDR